jgi:hypothetical protein
MITKLWNRQLKGHLNLFGPPLSTPLTWSFFTVWHYLCHRAGDSLLSPVFPTMPMDNTCAIFRLNYNIVSSSLKPSLAAQVAFRTHSLPSSCRLACNSSVRGEHSALLGRLPVCWRLGPAWLSFLLSTLQKYEKMRHCYTVHWEFSHEMWSFLLHAYIHACICLSFAKHFSECLLLVRHCDWCWGPSGW